MNIRNQIYELKYYNEYQKNRYLKELTESEYAFNARILARARRTEELYDKDLYDFSLPELEQFFKYLKPGKAKSSRQNCYYVNNYIEWANAQKLRATNINPLAGRNDEEFYIRFVDETKKTLFTEDEINEIVDGCVNAQDSVIVQLIFEGVVGDAVEELLNLREKNIDFNNNRLMLYNRDGSTRIIEVSEKSIRLIREALQQKEYLKKNGEAAENTMNPVAQLYENDFVIKNTVNKRASEGKVDKFLIYRRIGMLAEVFEYPYLTVTNIRDSGMLKMAKDLLKERGELGKEEYNTISNQFNIKKVKLNDVMVYNYFSYKQVFLNEETIRKMYGEELE